MKLNKKKLNNILSQIKAHLNVVVMMNNPEHPGLIDFLFQPKSREVEFGYLNRLTCGTGDRDDLFADTVIEMLDKPLVVNIARLHDALKGGEPEPELVDGTVNGINIQISTDDLKAVSVGRSINMNFDAIKDFEFSDRVKFVMPRIDYELMVNSIGQFVSQDINRIFMCGYDVDFSTREDFINFVATDGRRLVVCKFPCKHPRMGNDNGIGGDFIFKPLNLFIPESVYSRTQWWINEYSSLIRIQTEDYSIDCWAKPIEGQFPNYIKVIPERELFKEWMNLNVRSARSAFDSIKGLIVNKSYSSVKNQVFFNAEDPKHIKLAIPDASVDIDGEASRPMCLRVSWDFMNSAFFDTPFTKFLFQNNVNKAILAEESRAVQGTTITVTKIVMPMEHEEYADEWGIVDLTKTQADSDNNLEESDFKSEDDTAIEYGDSLDGDD
jgi:DNA polymerase III sliding clamp (beta) subunit (PCNA family)